MSLKLKGETIDITFQLGVRRIQLNTLAHSTIFHHNIRDNKATALRKASIY
jgi:hypothetical protein